MGVYYLIVPILFTISTLTSLLMFYKFQRLRSQRMGTTESNVTAATFETINIPMSEEVQYESPDDMGDKSANEDWLQIRLLAEHLTHIPKHRNVVEIVAADTIKLPYYIYTEYITNGTLRDVLCKAKYDDVYSKTIYMQGLSRSAQSFDALRIGSFLLEPLKAPFFLESIDENLRLPWFPPETIFKKHYAVFIAVFIWEIFSQGASPFGGLDIIKFAAQPDALPVLSKPELCSDSLYAIMTSCLKVDPADRISLTSLKTKLFQLIESID